MFKLPEIKLTVLGNCGKEHANFEEWQACHVCEAIANQHNQTGKFKGEVIARNEREHDRIWNVAIEAAIDAMTLSIGEGHLLTTHTAMVIRKLKK